jgi:uncharacterized membrane protein YkoI
MKKILAGLFAFAFFVALYVQPVFAQTVSAARAGEIAVGAAGGGAVSSLEMITEGEGTSVFRIVVADGNMRYEVFVNAGSGEVSRLRNWNDQSRSAMPDSPRISESKAEEIAKAHLDSQGFRQAVRDKRTDMDWERGRWVWELEYSQGRGWDEMEFEFYIDAETGEILKFEID